MWRRFNEKRFVRFESIAQCLRGQCYSTRARSKRNDIGSPTSGCYHERKELISTCFCFWQIGPIPFSFYVHGPFSVGTELFPFFIFYAYKPVTQIGYILIFSQKNFSFFRTLQRSFPDQLKMKDIQSRNFPFRLAGAIPFYSTRSPTQPSGTAFFPFYPVLNQLSRFYSFF